MGQQLGRYYLKEHVDQESGEGGSCILVVATDAPLDARQLKRVARRSLLALAAVGSPMTHGSGDYTIAFSTNPKARVPYESNSRTRIVPVLRDETLSTSP